MRLHSFTAPLEALRIGFLWGSFGFFLVGVGSSIVPALDVAPLFVLFPAGFVLGAGYAIARYLRFEYELTEDTFDVTSGVVARKHREIPIRRVQNLDIGRSLFQRLVGLAVVTVETAGGSESEARLKFVGHETARHLQDGIRKRKAAITDAEPTADREDADPESVAEPTPTEGDDTKQLVTLPSTRLATCRRSLQVAQSGIPPRGRPRPDPQRVLAAIDPRRALPSPPDREPARNGLSAPVGARLRGDRYRRLVHHAVQPRAGGRLRPLRGRVDAGDGSRAPP